MFNALRIAERKGRNPRVARWRMLHEAVKRMHTRKFFERGKVTLTPTDKARLARDSKGTSDDLLRNPQIFNAASHTPVMDLDKAVDSSVRRNTIGKVGPKAKWRSAAATRALVWDYPRFCRLHMLWAGAADLH
jgi:hypothetical protein